MRFCVQRRSIQLEPTSDEDIQWIATQYNSEALWTNFGFDGPARRAAITSYFQYRSINGIIRSVASGTRIGFVNLIRNEGPKETWRFLYAIVKPAHRNAFHAMFTLDAFAYYAFEHCKVENIEWSVRADNGPSLAVIRRLGYEAHSVRNVNGVKYLNYTVNEQRWEQRKAALTAKCSEPFKLSATSKRPNLIRFLDQLTIHKPHNEILSI